MNDTFLIVLAGFAVIVGIPLLFAANREGVRRRARAAIAAERRKASR